MLIVMLLLTMSVQALLAQRTITGTVTSESDGEPLPGVTVVLKTSPSTGAVSDFEGKYQIKVPEGQVTLVFSFIGMQTKEIITTESTVLDVVLMQDQFGLDEVIVTGVASGTQRKKMSVSVTRVGAEQLEEVPATSAASALQGKVAGVTITQSAGQPGQAATIVIRGATQMNGSQEPLIIVDGVMIGGTLADVNADDIESYEVVKGASASALYGSRAGNGVIVITTKSGEHLGKGETNVRIRNEYGMSRLAKKYDLAEAHQYKLADDWQSYKTYTRYAGMTYPSDYNGGNSADIVFSRDVDDDNYMDNPYSSVADHQGDLFSGSESYTNYIAVESNLGATNFLASFENNNQGGVIDMIDGYSRQNFRLNVNHNISDKLSIKTNNLYIKSKTSFPGGGEDANLYNGGVFFNLLLMQPDVNLNLKNPDGQPYQFIPDPFAATTENPLYNIWKLQNENKRDRLLSSYSLNYAPTSWVSFDAKYAFELQTRSYTEFEPYDTYERGGSVMGQYSKGRLYKLSSRRFDETAQATANFQQLWGDFTMKAKLSYLYERRFFESMEVSGRDFSYNIERIADFDNISDVANITADNESEEEVTRNYFGIASLDYLGKYIFDAMYRIDGSSLFGEDERWNPYYRVSGAYRITEDFTIPMVPELKIRAAYGTSGQRPGFSYQYETMSLSSGVASKLTLGNTELKPSRSTEWEIGLNAFFLNRFNLEATYSVNETSDQFVKSPKAVHTGGWEYKWINGGTLEAKSFELTIGAQVLKSDFEWDVNFTFDKVKTKVTKLDVPAFQYGPQGQEAAKLFYMREGEEFGTMYGYRFLTSLDEMAAQLAADQTISDFEINSDGYVVPAGSQGTNLEKPVMKKDETGTVAQVKIGDGTPDFNLRFASTMKYKGFTFYMLWDWKRGGDVYNKTAQWLTRDDRWSKMDQTGKPENEKKTVTYYKTFYAINEMADYWVEDASFLKLREASLYYTLPKSKLSGVFKGFIKEIKVGFIGRNLLTFTKYTGYDPEVQTWTDDGVQYFPYDFMGYPNYRSYSGSIEIKF